MIGSELEKLSTHHREVVFLEVGRFLKIFIMDPLPMVMMR